MSIAVEFVERTLGRSMVACFGGEAIEMNGLQDVGFVWVVLYLGYNYQCQYREAGLLGTSGVIWDGLRNLLCLDFRVLVTNSGVSTKP